MVVYSFRRGYGVRRARIDDGNRVFCHIFIIKGTAEMSIREMGAGRDHGRRITPQENGGKQEENLQNLREKRENPPCGKAKSVI
jgi:hypothetical protein